MLLRSETAKLLSSPVAIAREGMGWARTAGFGQVKKTEGLRNSKPGL